MTEPLKLLGTNQTGITTNTTARSLFKSRTRIMRHYGSKILQTAMERILNTTVNKHALPAAIAIFQ